MQCNNCGSQNTKKFITVRGDRKIGSAKGKFPVVICRECGLCFLDPQPGPAEYRHYYQDNKVNQIISDRVKVLEKKRYQLNYVRWFAKHAVIPFNAKILDIGCGRGTFLHFLRNAGYTDLAGLEISPRAARAAQTQFALKVYPEDIFSATLPRESFDAVTAIAFLEHMNNPKSAVRQIAAFLKPAGMVYFVTPEIRGMNFRSKFFKFVHTHYFSPLTLQSILEQCGFEVVAKLAVPAIRRYSTIFFPDNCLSGELHIIARKTGAGLTAPLKDDYQDILACYRRSRIGDSIYEFMYKLIYSKYGRPLRALRSLDLIKRYFKPGDPYHDLNSYFASEI